MSKKPTGDDYEVGYGKPPKASRFQKGRSGNPKGRKPRADHIAALVSEEGRKRLKVKIEGVERSHTKSELIAIRLVNKAVGGDLRAAAFVIDLQQKGKAAEVEEANQAASGRTARDELRAKLQRIFQAADEERSMTDEPTT